MIAALFEHHRDLVPRELEMRMLPMCVPQPQDKVKIVRNVWKKKPAPWVICLPDLSDKLPLPRMAQEKRAQVIVQEVCQQRNLPLEKFFGVAKFSYLASARHEACYRIAKETDLSLPEIGALIKKDHTTVMHAINRHCEMHGLKHPRRKHETGHRRVSVPGKLLPEMA